MRPMSLLFALIAVGVALATGFRLRRREKLLAAEVCALTERIQELTARVDAAEDDVAHAITQTEIAESLLVEKGVADEDDIEAVRQRYVADGAPPPVFVRGRDGDLH
jgi:hypothetical protein